MAGLNSSLKLDGETLEKESLFAVLNTLNRTLPKAFRQTQIGNKHDVDDTRLENQRVAMEDVR